MSCISLLIFSVIKPHEKFNCKNKDITLFISSLFGGIISYFGILYTGFYFHKPVIYLYPEEVQDVSVKLMVKGSIKTTYPKYSEEIQGWNVLASPDGKITNLSDGCEYPYLFWDAEVNNLEINRQKGFIVKGEETVSFLKDSLYKIGLTNSEINEFIVYWLPLMEHNKYNFITFLEKEYTDTALLDITPKPESILRVFMVFEKISEKKASKLLNLIEPIEFQRFQRTGFTVIEWGGAEIN